MNPHFSPWGTAPRPCWHCRDFRGLIYAGTAAACGSAIGPRVRSMPAHGCSGFEREPGSDDEPERVPESVVVEPGVRVSKAMDTGR